MTRATCGVCEWTCETGNGVSRRALDRAMIDHHVTTGHAPVEVVLDGPEADHGERPTEKAGD